MNLDKNKIITSDFDIPPDRIDLSIGQPGMTLLPLASLAQAAQHCLTRKNPYILAYGAEQGNGYFHDALAGFLSKQYNFKVDADHLFTTAGISQGLDFICSLFTRPGDIVFVEKPTYSLVLGIFADHGLNVVGLPMDKNGLIIEALEEELGLRERAATAVPGKSPIRSHPSHLEVISECGSESDFSPRKSCLIEPHRLCSNSGYCKKLGY